jgi:hypothetical protein
MRLRNRHLACLLLLLSSLSAADAHALRSGDLTLGGRYISSLLGNLMIQSAAAAVGTEPLAQSVTAHRTEAFVLPPASRALNTAAWTMRPPASHTATLHAVTSQLS